MRAQTFRIALLSLTVAWAPLSALACPQTDAAEMACCRQGMSECHKPGKTDDCCRHAPADKDGSALIQKAERSANLAPTHFLAPEFEILTLPGRETVAPGPGRTLLPDHSPPPLRL